jgi:hypothetical protein
MILLPFTLHIAIYPCLEVARSSYCVLSLGWPNGPSAQLIDSTDDLLDKDNLQATGTLTTFISSLARVFLLRDFHRGAH